jgi:hypothetical protein
MIAQSLDEIVKREAQKCAEMFPASFGLRACDFEPIIRRACEEYREILLDGKDWKVRAEKAADKEFKVPFEA